VKAAIPANLSFEQLLLMVKQLPVQQKIKLTKVHLELAVKGFSYLVFILFRM
jgi:hypothetical protein